MVSLFRSLYEFPKPTIAAVNGAAIAGGTGLALLCDFTLAVPEAKFGYTEVRIGFVPAIVSTFLLRQVGEKIARDLLLTGRIFDAAEALKMGLINEIVRRKNCSIALANWPRCWRRTSLVASSYQTLADRPRARAARYANGNGDSRECRDSRERRFPRRDHVVSGKAQTEVDGR